MIVASLEVCNLDYGITLKSHFGNNAENSPLCTSMFMGEKLVVYAIPDW